MEKHECGCGEECDCGCDDKGNLLAEFEIKFEEMRKQLGFKVSFEELDRAFFLRDGVLRDSFVAHRIDRQVSSKIRDAYNAWLEYFHNLILPNPHNIINSNESKFVTEEDKKQMLKLMTDVMVLVSKNSIVGIKGDKKMQAEFFDESYKFWNSTFKPFAERIMEKVGKSWKEMSDKK